MAESPSTPEITVDHLLKNLLSPQVYNDLLENDGEIDGTLQKVLQQEAPTSPSSLPDGAESNLLLLSELANQLKLPPQLYGKVILHSNDPIVQTVIDNFWRSWSVDSRRRAYATELFEAKPALIVKNLVRQEKFDMSPTMRADVIQMLEDLGPKFNFLKDTVMPHDEAVIRLTELRDPGRKEAALGFVTSIQQLSRVIIEPLDLPVLKNLSFSSLEQIAYTPLETLQALVAPHGIQSDHARRIHAEATSLQMRVEQSFMALIQSSQDDSTISVLNEPASGETIPDTNTKNAATPPGSSLAPSRDNFSSWFGDLDEVGCKDCCSVTSPAAYLVDLFRLLKNLPSGTGPSLLSKLFERRPDLGDLLLSCRNTSELVPYIDLVNETLESTVVYLESHPSLKDLKLPAYNADSYTHGQEETQLSHDAVNTRYEVYDRFIMSKAYPSSTFPYDHSKDALNRYLAASNITPAELLNTFSSRACVAKDPTLGMLSANEAIFNTVYNKQFAAEVIGMSRLNFIAITAQDFYDFAATSLLKPDSAEKDFFLKDSRRPSISSYWGYQDQSKFLSTDENDALGICFIKKQLLPRLDLQFSTLVQILETQFMSGSFRVSPIRPDEKLDLEKTRAARLDDFRLVGIEGTAIKDTEIFRYKRLDIFVRIWRQLGWSIEAVDDALYVLQPDTNWSGSDAEIQPDTIEQLAAISELSRLTKAEPSKIASLVSSSSQYFCHLPIVQSIQSSRVSPPQREHSEEQHLPLLLSSLRMSHDDYTQIKEREKLGDGLSIPSIFKYHQVAEAARMFSVDPTQISQLINVLCEKSPASAMPKEYLSALKAWKLLQSEGWDISDLISASTRSDTPVAQVVDKSTLKFIGTLLSSIKTSATLASSSSQASDKVIEQSLPTVLHGFFPKMAPESINTLLKLSFGNETLSSQLLPETKPSPVEFKTADFDGALFFHEDTVIHLETSLQAPTETRFRMGEETYMLLKKQTTNTYECDVAVSAGSAVYLSWPTNFKDTVISFKHPRKAETVTEPDRIVKERVLDVQQAIGQVRHWSILLKPYPLNVSELDMFVDITKYHFGYDKVCCLQNYVWARKALAKTGKVTEFAQLIHRLLQEEYPTKLAVDFSQVTLLSKTMAETLLSHNFSNFSGWRNATIGLKALRKLSEQVHMMARLGLNESSLDLLFKVALPPPYEVTEPPTSGKQRPITRLVKLLHAALVNRGSKNSLKAAHDSLRENRRKALVQYILHHPKLSKLGLVDPDDLFQLFLIDAQMGAGLETTRVKQAISTVQLFVHRCLLGLENGIDGSSVIPRDRWAWMSRYNLWEANRKVFLYPENWADPTLRDNKTELFRSIEEAIMKANLDEKTVCKMIRSYVYGADEIANLQVQAFYWEKVPALDKKPEEPVETGIFHFIAQTRNPPYLYYYRRLEYLAEGGRPAPQWSAWEKLPFNPQSHQVDHKGKTVSRPGSYVIPASWRKRLIVFLPLILLVPETVQGPTQISMHKPSSSANPDDMEVSLKSGQPSNVQHNIEIKMAWSELIDGVWSAQKQSHDAHVVKGSDGKPPPVDSFRFSINHTQQSLSVVLYQSNGTTTDILGQFNLHGPKLSFTTDKADQPPQLDPKSRTLFGQLDEVGSNDFESLLDNPTRGTPQLAEDEKRNVSAMTWTFDSWADSGNPRALVVDLVIKNKFGHEPWFTLPHGLPFKHRTREERKPYSIQLFNTVNDDIRAATSTEDGVDAIYQVMNKVVISEPGQPLQDNDYAFGCHADVAQCREDASPYALYNWEIGFHLISLLVERLASLQAFDLAIKYARLVFDPTGTNNPSPTSSGQCNPIWRFPPFRSKATLQFGKLDSTLDGLQPSAGGDDTMAPAIRAWRHNPFRPHTVARGRPLAYMKRFVMKYMEALIASGDVYFEQNSLETMPLAIERYIEASHVFGPSPESIPSIGKQQFKSYNDLEKQFDDFSNASISLNLSLPYILPLSKRGGSKTNNAAALQSIWLTRYFGVQANPEFMKLRKTIDKRLFQIRNSLDINGNPRTLSLWDPPLDVGNLVAAVAAGSGSGLESVVLDVPKIMPKHRFMYLIQKAYELCSELKQASETLLSAIERGDGEAMQRLHLNQETGMQRILVEMKQKQKLEAEAALEQLEESRKSAALRLTHYAALTGEAVTIPTASSSSAFKPIQQNIPAPSDTLRLSEQEKLEANQADSASALNQQAAWADFASAILAGVPTATVATEPWGIGVDWQMISASQFPQVSATKYRARALEDSNSSRKAARTSQFTRQLQERHLQLNLAGYEINSIDKQIKAQSARIAGINKDIEAQKKKSADMVTVQDFLHSKFSNKELYSWYENSVRNYLHQTYLVTMELARRVEVAYRFEQGPSARPSLAAKGYWDQGKDGLQCGQQLWFALKQLEMSYLHETRHNFELTKNISLRQLDPSALLRLRETGDATFELPEIVFDLDFPGHYFRRIKSVTMSFPGITNPHAQINCTATLLDHSYRSSSSADPSYLPGADGKDPRFTHDDIQVPITSVAISSGSNNAGVFELDFGGERYQPFEGAGAISKWRLRLPDKEFWQFDYATLGDVVMQIRYTAKDGGESLRKAATDGARQYLQTTAKASKGYNLSLLLDARCDYADAWHTLTTTPAAGDSHVLSLNRIKDKLPFFARKSTVKIASVTIYAKGPDMEVSSFHISDKNGQVEQTAEVSPGTKLGEMQTFPVTTNQLQRLENMLNTDSPWYLTLKTGDDEMRKLNNIWIMINYTRSA